MVARLSEMYLLWLLISELGRMLCLALSLGLQNQLTMRAVG